MSALLEVDGLNMSFGGLKAVRDLSFAVGEREILGLAPENRPCST
jgi:ABC-type branched-subunit amino acid transport system ATPase component